MLLALWLSSGLSLSVTALIGEILEIFSIFEKDRSEPRDITQTPSRFLTMPNDKTTQNIRKTAFAVTANAENLAFPPKRVFSFTQRVAQLQTILSLACTRAPEKIAEPQLNLGEERLSSLLSLLANHRDLARV